MQSSLFRFPPLFGSLDCQAASFGIFHGVAQAQFALLAGFQLQSPGDDAALLVQLASAQLLGRYSDGAVARYGQLVGERQHDGFRACVAHGELPRHGLCLVRTDGAARRIVVLLGAFDADAPVAAHREAECVARLTGIEDALADERVFEIDVRLALQQVESLPAGGLRHEEGVLVDLRRALVDIGGRQVEPPDFGCDALAV